MMSAGYLNCMIQHALWIIILLGTVAVTGGNGRTDAERCISKDDGSSTVYKLQYCQATKRDVQISCAPNEVVSVTSLQLAIKTDRDICTKRVLDSGYMFCCTLQDNDELYNSDCLQDVWNTEDRAHYHEFIRNVLTKCRNVSQCLINSSMFSNLQRRIPGSKMYSSYFQVLHQCMPAPTNTVSVCSSRTVSGKEIHIQGLFDTDESAHRSCTCSVTSQSGSPVLIQAVDVRTAHTGFIIRSEDRTTNMSYSPQPLFGFKDIFSSNKINIEVKPGSTTTGDNLWLHLSASGGTTINVICGDLKKPTPVTTPRSERTSTPPGRVAPVLEEEDTAVPMEYWPLIYVAAGSIFTLVLLACIVGGIFICRYSRKKQKRREHPYGYPSEFRHDPMNESHYATVPDLYPHMPDPRMTMSLHRPHSRPDRGMDRTGHSTLRRNQGMPPDVSQLEAFLEFKDQTQDERAPGMSGLQDGSNTYPHLHGPQTGLDSGFTNISHH